MNQKNHSDVVGVCARSRVVLCSIYWGMCMKNVTVAVKLMWLCLMCAVVPISAQAKTIEVKSENFVFVGNVNEKGAKALVTELEQYRSAILQMLGAEAFPEPIPVRIFAVKSDKEMKTMTGIDGIAGVYRTTVDGPIFILNAKGGFRRGKQARHVALHEYTHHVLAAYTNQFYPRWYNEGLANYFATFKVNKKGQLVIGRPNQQYGYVLAQKTWMPTDIVVNSIRRYPFKSYGTKGSGLGMSDYFYAQTWLAVHYIQSHPDEGKKMTQYVKLLNATRNPKDAFTEAFGRTPEVFHKELKAYQKKNRYKYITITHKYDVSVKPLKVTPLDKGQAAFRKAEAMRFFSGNNVKTATISAQYDKAEKILGETLGILTARADLASWENEYDKSMKYIQKALQQAPESAHVNRTLGMLYVYKNDDDNKVPNGDELVLARKHLKKALRVDPNDMGSHYHYAKTFVMGHKDPTPQAIASAETALDYYRSSDFADSNLMFANILMNAGKYEAAKLPIEKAKIWGHSSGSRMAARSMGKHLARLEARAAK